MTLAVTFSPFEHADFWIQRASRRRNIRIVHARLAAQRWRHRHPASAKPASWQSAPTRRGSSW